MEINVQLEGMERLMANLQRMGVNTDVFLDIALEKGAKRLQAEIKPLVPVDEGTLRNSISVEKAGHLKYSVGTNLKYAVPVEFGTGKFGDPAVAHTTKDSWVYFDSKNNRFVTTHGQKPTHFMHNGFMAGKDDAVETVRKELRKWLT